MEDVFTKVYEEHIWGDDINPNYKGNSGGGSDIGYNINTYVPFLQNFIKENNIQTVVDLGCGDFRCGPYIYNELNIQYTGYDAYKNVIDFHKKNYTLPKYNFIHSEFYGHKEDIESGDLCILKDVVQHWSLECIYTFLDYLVESKKFKYILLICCCSQTEDNPEIVNGGYRPLHSRFFPLKKYNCKPIYYYHTKEVCLITRE